jgi:hypothetical protein
VKAAFTMCQVDNRAAMLRVNDPTRKSHADEAKDYQNRIAPFIHGTGGGGPSISIRPTSPALTLALRLRGFGT